MHIILDIIRILFLIGILNDLMQEPTGKVNTVDGPCNVSMRSSECLETLFFSEYNLVP